MPTRARHLDPSELKTHMGKIFDQVKTTSANHQKNVVALYKLHTSAAEFTTTNETGEVELTGEYAFRDTFSRMLYCMFDHVKKLDPQTDRTVKFIGQYLRYINEKAFEERKAREDANLDEDTDTIASRLSEYLLRFLKRGTKAKDKFRRYRAIRIVSEIIEHLGDVDEDILASLQNALLERLEDSQALVRVEAATALCKRYICVGPSGDDNDSLLAVLMDSMTYDPSEDVRHAILAHLPFNERTLPKFLERTRDVHVKVRKSVLRLLEDSICIGGEPGFAHPKNLSPQERELIVRDGLGDRDSVVRNAAASLVGAWSDCLAKERVKAEDSLVANPAQQNAIALLELFDLRESDTADMVMKALFSARPSLFKELVFDDEYWKCLFPKTAFLARVFVDHCDDCKDEERLDSALPAVTALAFTVEGIYEHLKDLMQNTALVDESEKHDTIFVLEQLLQLSVHLDYGDEIGRRKANKLMCNMVIDDLPNNILSRCLDVLQHTSDSDKDLIRILVEQVNGLADEKAHGNISQASQRSSDTVSAGTAPVPLDIQMKCLDLCIGILQRVNTIMDDQNLTAITLDFVRTALSSRSSELKHKAVLCLVYVCLISPSSAVVSFEKLLDGVETAQPDTKLIIYQAIFDLLLVHTRQLLSKCSNKVQEFVSEMLDFTSKRNQNPDMLAEICIGLEKLTFHGITEDNKVLTQLALAYLDPVNTNNEKLRQSLAYFLPRFSYSRPSNQRKMLDIFPPVAKEWQRRLSNSDDEDALTSFKRMCEMFLDWLDPCEVFKVNGQKGDEQLPLDFAVVIIKTLFDDDLDTPEKKILCQTLNKLVIPNTVDDDNIRTLKILMSNLHLRRPLLERVSKTAFKKFEDTILEKFETQLKDFNEEEFMKLEKSQDLFAFLDDVMPLDEEDADVDRKKGIKRRSRADSLISSDSDSRRSTPKERKAAKRARQSSLKEESDYEATHLRVKTEGSPSPLPPPRRLPKRSTAGVGGSSVLNPIEISSDSDDSVIEIVPPKPIRNAPPKSGKARNTGSGRPKNAPKASSSGTRVGGARRGISNTSASAASRKSSARSDYGHDSLFDASGAAGGSEDSEGEVNDLLVGDDD